MSSVDVDAVALEASLAAAEPSARGGRASYDRRRVPRELLVVARPNHLLAMAAIDVSILFAALVAMAFVPIWALPLPMLVVASRLHAFGVILHDACHCPRERDDWRMRVVEVVVGYPIGSTIRAMAYHHLRHHRDTGHPTDPYFKAGIEESRLLYTLYVLRGAILVPWWTLRAFVGVLALALPGLREFYARAFLQDRSGAPVAHTADVRACLRAEPGQALFAALLIAATVRWPAALAIGYWIPAVLGGILSAYRLLSEHVYISTNDRRVDTILATTRDHEWGWLGAALFFPRNIGLHAVHHLHPQVALEHLPALKRWYLVNHPRYPQPRGRIDVRTLGAIAVELAICTATIALTLHYWSAASALGAMVVLATRQHALFMLYHDGVHGNLSRLPRLNDALINFLIGMPQLLPIHLYRALHLAHHRALGTAADPERILLYRDQPWQYRPLAAWPLARQLAGELSGLNTLRMLWRYERERRDPSSKLQLPAVQVAPETWLIGAVWIGAALALAWLLPQTAARVALLWLVPLFTLTPCLQKIRSFAEHSDGEDAELSYSWRVGGLGRLTIWPYGINYHREHHRSPGIPWHELPRAYPHAEQRPSTSLPRLLFNGRLY